MGDLSKNFSRHEFACKCGCGFDTVDAELLRILQSVRDHFGRAVTITSACRCETHNARVGGTSGSQHLRGRAGDIVVSGVEPVMVADYINRMDSERNGIGRYSDFTHVDTRTGRARW